MNAIFVLQDILNILSTSSFKIVSYCFANSLKAFIKKTTENLGILTSNSPSNLKMSKYITLSQLIPRHPVYWRNVQFENTFIDPDFPCQFFSL